jgi:hypothetical protein
MAPRLQVGRLGLRFCPRLPRAGLFTALSALPRCEEVRLGVCQAGQLAAVVAWWWLQGVPGVSTDHERAPPDHYRYRYRYRYLHRSKTEQGADC